MSAPPDRPKIYHITHIENLPRILAEGGLFSDSEIIRRGGPAQAIGMSGIKQRRVERLEVSCHPGTKVGDYVPFYFCPRSIMLYVLHQGNHPELTYRDGQEPIVHLEADLHAVVAWADRQRARWAFSLSNAGAFYAEFRSQRAHLNELNWLAIAATNFQPPNVKEAKQAEFLVHSRFPFELVERIGVRSGRIQGLAAAHLANSPHRPVLEVRPEWYF